MVSGMPYKIFAGTGLSRPHSFSSTGVHCEIVHSVAAAYRALHVFPVTPPIDIRLYSCAQAQRMTVDSDTVADSILQQALTGFNFPLLIRQAWQDGIRLFVELGTGRILYTNDPLDTRRV